MLSKRARVNTVRTHVSIGHMYTCRVQSVHCSVSCIQYLCWAKSLSRLTMCCRNCCFVWRTARRRNHKTLISSILITAVLRRCGSLASDNKDENEQTESSGHSCVAYCSVLCLFQFSHYARACKLHGEQIDKDTELCGDGWLWIRAGALSWSLWLFYGLPDSYTVVQKN